MPSWVFLNPPFVRENVLKKMGQIDPSLVLVGLKMNFVKRLIYLILQSSKVITYIFPIVLHNMRPQEKYREQNILMQI